ncbi:MAG: hypothetical protein ACRDY2_02260 [Acidimicrobiales bacterium]
MSTRYLSNALIALLGGLVVVTSLTLATVPAAWVGFGIAIGVVAVSLLVQLDAKRGAAQRGLDAMMLAAGVTMIVLSLVLGATTVGWALFALALGFVALSFAGLTLHEVLGWRSEHGLGELHWLDTTHRAGHRGARREHMAA